MTFVWDICILMMIYGFALLLVFDFMTPVAAVVVIFDSAMMIATKYNLVSFDAQKIFKLGVYFVIKIIFLSKKFLNLVIP